ncbi:MAG: glycosyltransferase, partial [Pseudomonadota bacterium]
VLDTLQEQGFLYDSSLCPIGKQFSDEEFRLRLHQHSADAGSIWEVPVSATRWLGWSIPFSGGNYVRQLPRWPVREAAARWVENRAAPLVMYFHIWEIDADQPNISAASWLQRMRHYRNLERMRDRMHYFLTRYPFSSIQDYLGFTQNRQIERATQSQDLRSEPETIAVQSTDKEYDLSIVIPCYNEEASLRYLNETLGKLKKTSSGLLKLNFIFVNDGSTDSTKALLTELFGDRPDALIVSHRSNQGIGQAIITGIDHATTEYIAVIDADCTFDPLQLPTMITQMESNTAVIAASPFHQRGRVANVPEWRLLLSRGAAFLYRQVLTHKFSGYTSCFRIYRADTVKGMRVYNPGFCGVTEILARLDLAGHELKECPAELQIRLLGQSKINLIRTTFDHLKLIVRLAAYRWLNVALPTPTNKVLVD